MAGFFNAPILCRYEIGVASSRKLALTNRQGQLIRGNKNKDLEHHSLIFEAEVIKFGDFMQLAMKSGLDMGKVGQMGSNPSAFASMSRDI
eukprot:CAMPEP_0115028582 /NCGR_PEP_ID=MMETSP0216-20121206/36408_1 /TAXON_ID=223996 /ORGANISM="Protocruzia adherens, Strain Boccale" /LENGTH=89 /DNA_ID=CAMNT_0002404837 /DNA_START=14 /DNA_END=280 /DNA_ORIENTATION=-